MTEITDTLHQMWTLALCIPVVTIGIAVVSLCIIRYRAHVRETRDAWLHRTH
jgi:hypothetical protein